MEQVRAQRESVHPHRHRLGDIARDDRGFERQVFLGAHTNVVARDDPLGLEDLIQARSDLRLGGVHALVERLHDQVIAVAIHYQRWQQVGLAVDHAIGIAVVDHGAAVLLGGAQTVQIEIAADLFYLPRKHPQGNLRSGAVVSCDPDRVATLGAIAIVNVAGKDPRMTAGDPAGRLAVHPDFVHRIS